MNNMLFVVNPIAGGGRTKRLIPEIKKLMNKKSVEYKILVTEKPKDGIKMAKRGIEEGYSTIIAVGGDGTVNEVAVAILELGRASLGIVPTGTGNDLARSLDIPFDLEESIEIVLKGVEKVIDIGYVNDKLFLNISSIGFDSEVVRNAEKIKNKIKSSIAYVISVFYTFLIFEDKKIRLEIDGKVINEQIFLAAIGNGKYYGGGIKILPMSIVDDGYFHVCIIGAVSKIKFLFSMVTVLRGNHEKLEDDVRFFKAKEVKITTEDEAYLNVDGEIYNVEEETLFTIGDEKITVFIRD